MPQNPQPVFVARGLTKTYQMGEVTVQALRGIDLEIYEREFVVLLGPSGSGKSTLFNILGGLETATALVEKGVAPSEHVIVYPSDAVQDGVRVMARSVG